MSFHSFLGTRGHSITFSINTMDMLCFIFCSQNYLNWLNTDILQLLSVMQILTVGDSKGHYFQSIHTCLLHLWRRSEVQIGYGAITCHVTIWKMTFYQDHLQLWIWVSANSIQVNCSLCPYVLHCHTSCFLCFYFTPHLPESLSPFYLRGAYTCLHALYTEEKHVQNCSIN